MAGWITRRTALAGLAGAAATRSVAAAPAEFPDRPTLLVGGPQGGATDDWATVVADALGRGLQLGSGLAAENIGGPDGVTAANQFQARIAPDGGTALLVPGAAPLCWLTGDTRVRFDAGRWTPLWGGVVPAAVLSRGPLALERRLRMGVDSVVGPELAGLLALHAIGCDVHVVKFDPTAGHPMGRSDLDLIFVRGSQLRGRRATLASQGWFPAFGFGVVAADGTVLRDLSSPELPTAQELITQNGRSPGLDMMAALGAAAAAATLDVALVLPLQTQAALVAWWRQGCSRLANAPEVQAQAARSAARPIGAAGIAATLQRMTVDASVLLELRGWLADRYQWQPS